MALQESSVLLNKLKDLYNKGDVQGASSTLTNLKLKLIELPSLPPVLQASSTAQQELSLAREAYEYAALIAVRQKDESAMERAFAQLRAFYMDTSKVLPSSSHEHELLGLNLLRLLVANRIAEFHTELELITPEALAHPYISHATQLERWLMQGAYNKLLEASKQCPTELHAILMSQLTTTVREEVASCCERAYTKLSLAEAQKLMMFDSPAAVQDYAQQAPTGKKGQEIAPMDLINNVLVYAKELQRIV